MLRVEEIKRQIDFLAWWKANQYLFYYAGKINRVMSCPPWNPCFNEIAQNAQP